MSITPVPELERLLDEHAEAKREFDKPLPRDEVEFYKREDRLLAAVGNVQKAATLDTLRALVAVARAAWVLADNIDTYCPCCDSHLEIVTEPLFDDATKVYAALAPLVKEADHALET